MKQVYMIGLMSGTSVDSVDAALVSISGHHVELIHGITFDIPAEIRESVFELFSDQTGALRQLTLMNIRLGDLFADAVSELLRVTDIKPHQVKAVASHGQTIMHVADPESCCGLLSQGTLQIGEGAVIAERTGITTISDFRVADIAAGGSGAPLVPYLDLILAEKTGCPVAFQNIGGIGNVTYLKNSESTPAAFDTGPGNMIADELVRRYTSNSLSYDQDGHIGLTGTADQGLLNNWMGHPYLKKSIPKTTGREEFGTEFIDVYLAGRKPDPDIIHTAEVFTACSISDAYRKYLPDLPEKVIVTGGGAHNPVIMDSLAEQLPECMIQTGDQAGISTDYKEAVAFALLGWCTMNKKPNNVPAATGARKQAVMGKVSYPF